MDTIVKQKIFQLNAVRKCGMCQKENCVHKQVKRKSRFYRNIKFKLNYKNNFQ